VKFRVRPALERSVGTNCWICDSSHRLSCCGLLAPAAWGSRQRVDDCWGRKRRTQVKRNDVRKVAKCQSYFAPCAVRRAVCDKGLRIRSPFLVSQWAALVRGHLTAACPLVAGITVPESPEIARCASGISPRPRSGGPVFRSDVGSVTSHPSLSVGFSESRQIGALPTLATQVWRPWVSQKTLFPRPMTECGPWRRGRSCCVTMQRFLRPLRLFLLDGMGCLQQSPPISCWCASVASSQSRQKPEPPDLTRVP
jgi:hypothetical protein